MDNIEGIGKFYKVIDLVGEWNIFVGCIGVKCVGYNERELIRERI